MKFYLSTRQIPQIAHLSFSERLDKITQATNKLTIPEKMLLNILKLLIIVPVFVFILQISTDWTSILWAALVILLYPLFIRPLQYTFAAKYLLEPEKDKT